MSKRSEERAFAYQLATKGPRIMGGSAILDEDEYKFWNINYDFKAGYEQAEKDLALTWEDMRTINDLFYKVDAENSAAWDYEVIEQDLPFPYGQKFYEEVLRRFRETKNK